MFVLVEPGEPGKLLQKRKKKLRKGPSSRVAPNLVDCPSVLEFDISAQVEPSLCRTFLHFEFYYKTFLGLLHFTNLVYLVPSVHFVLFKCLLQTLLNKINSILGFNHSLRSIFEIVYHIYFSVIITDFFIGICYKDFS